MKVATTTTVLSKKADVAPSKQLFNEMALCKAAGFTTLDVRLSTQAKVNYPLAGAGWESWARGVRVKAEKMGLTFPQSHSFVYRSSEGTDPNIDRQWYDERIRRSIIASGILGTKWVVIHPLDFYNDPVYNFDKNKRFNLEYWAPFVELAIKHKVGIAFENLYPSGNLPQRYCAQGEELIDLVDSFKSPYVGMCWDTGHAAVAGQDQPKVIQKAGSRIKALHIHDNHLMPKGDEHLLPYLGKLNWKPIYKALADIGYDQVFSLEIKGAVRNIPPDMSLDMVGYMYKLANHMVQAIELEKQQNRPLATTVGL